MVCFTEKASDGEWGGYMCIILAPTSPFWDVEQT